MLNSIRKQLLLLHRFAWKHPLATLSFTGLIFFISIFGIGRLQFLLSIDDLIDPDFQTYETLMKVNSEFRDKNTVLLSIESKTLFTKPFLCDLQLWVLKVAENRSDIAQIQTTFGVRQAQVINNQFKMDSFLDLDCLDSNPESEKIEKGFKQIKKSPWQGILTAYHDYTLTINFIVYDPPEKTFGSIDVTIVPALQKSFDEDFFYKYKTKEKIAFYWGGITTYQSYLRNAFDQTQFLNGLMFIISLLIFRVFLGSWKAGFIFNFTIFISMTITYGIMGFLNISVDVLTNTTGLMMIVGCLEDFIFVIFGMLRFKWNMRKSLRRFMLASFFTSLTTAIGFASLVTSDLSIIRRFGLISAFAALLEWAMVYLFLPALVKKMPYLQNIKFSLPKINLKFTQKNIVPRWLAIVLCIPIVVPFIWSDHLTIKDSPASFFFDSHIVLKTTEHFKKTRGWVTEVSVVFNNQNTDQENKQILSQIKKIKFVENVEDFYTVSNYLTANLDSSDKNLIQNIWEDSPFSKRLKSYNGVHRAQLFLGSMEMDDVKTVIDSFNTICQNKKCDLVGSLISYNEFSIKILNTLFSSLGLSIFLVVLLLISVRKTLAWSDTLSLVVSSIWGPLVLLTIFIVFKIPLSFVSCICASLLEGLAGDNAIQFIFSSKKANLNQSVNDLSEGSLIVTIGMIMLISVFMFSVIASIAILGVYILAGLALAFFGDVFILKGLLKK